MSDVRSVSDGSGAHHVIASHDHTKVASESAKRKTSHSSCTIEEKETEDGVQPSHDTDGIESHTKHSEGNPEDNSNDSNDSNDSNIEGGMRSSQLAKRGAKRDQREDDEREEQSNKRQRSTVVKSLTKVGSIRVRVAVLRVQAQVANNMQKFSHRVEETLQGTHASVRFYAGVRSSVYDIRARVSDIMAAFSDEVDVILADMHGQAITRRSFQRLTSASSRAQSHTDHAMRDGLDMFESVAQLEEASVMSRRSLL